MINVDLRRYGTDKEYEKAVNSFLKGDPLTLECEFEKDSVEKLKKLFNIPEDIQKKIVDIYNYMATNKNGKIVLQFETGIKMICEIDTTEWKNPPRIDLKEVVLKGDN